MYGVISQPVFLIIDVAASILSPIASRMLIYHIRVTTSAIPKVVQIVRPLSAVSRFQGIAWDFLLHFGERFPSNACLTVDDLLLL